MRERTSLCSTVFKFALLPRRRGVFLRALQLGLSTTPSAPFIKMEAPLYVQKRYYHYFCNTLRTAQNSGSRRDVVMRDTLN